MRIMVRYEIGVFRTNHEESRTNKQSIKCVPRATPMSRSTLYHPTAITPGNTCFINSLSQLPNKKHIILIPTPPYLSFRNLIHQLRLSFPIDYWNIYIYGCYASYPATTFTHTFIPLWNVVMRIASSPPQKWVYPPPLLTIRYPEIGPYKLSNAMRVPTRLLGGTEYTNKNRDPYRGDLV